MFKILFFDIFMNYFLQRHINDISKLKNWIKYKEIHKIEIKV